MASHAETVEAVAAQIRELHQRCNELRTALHNALPPDVEEELTRLGVAHSPPLEPASYALLTVREQKAAELLTLTLRVGGRSIGRCTVSPQAWAGSSSRFDLPALISTCDALSELNVQMNSARDRAEQLALDNEVLREENLLFRAVLTGNDPTVMLPPVCNKPGQGVQQLLQPHVLSVSRRSLCRPSSAQITGRTVHSLTRSGGTLSTPHTVEGRWADLIAEGSLRDDASKARVRELMDVDDVEGMLGRRGSPGGAVGSCPAELSEAVSRAATVATDASGASLAWSVGEALTPLMLNEVKMLRMGLAEHQRHVRLLEHELDKRAASEAQLAHELQRRAHSQPGRTTDGNLGEELQQLRTDVGVVAVLSGERQDELRLTLRRAQDDLSSALADRATTHEALLAATAREADAATEAERAREEAAELQEQVRRLRAAESGRDHDLEALMLRVSSAEAEMRDLARSESSELREARERARRAEAAAEQTAQGARLVEAARVGSREAELIQELQEERLAATRAAAAAATASAEAAACSRGVEGLERALAYSEEDGKRACEQADLAADQLAAVKAELRAQSERASVAYKQAEYLQRELAEERSAGASMAALLRSRLGEGGGGGGGALPLSRKEEEAQRRDLQQVLSRATKLEAALEAKEGLVGVLTGLLSATATQRLVALDRATQRRAMLDWLLDRAEVVLGRLDLRISGRGGRGRGRGGIAHTLETNDLQSIRGEIEAVRVALADRLGAATRSESDMLRQHEERLQAAVQAFSAERERLLAQIVRADGWSTTARVRPPPRVPDVYHQGNGLCDTLARAASGGGRASEALAQIAAGHHRRKAGLAPACV
jgi:hypothetical protein